MSANLPQPGWYEDPADPSRLRLWDGAAWTTEVRPAPTAAPAVAPAAAEAAAGPDPFVPLDLGAVSGGHGGGSPEPQPDPDPFVPLELDHIGGGHGGGPAEPQPDPDPFVPLDLGPVAGAHGGGPPAGGALPAPEPSSLLPGPSVSDALPGPSADPAVEAAEPSPVARLAARLPDLGGPGRPSWPVLSAGAAAIAALVATAALTLGGGGDGPAVDPDAAYAACQTRVTEVTEVDGLEFAPHGEVAVTETADGMALDFWALHPVGPQRRREPVDLRCDVATGDGEASVTAVVVGLEQAGRAAAITP